MRRERRCVFLQLLQLLPHLLGQILEYPNLSRELFKFLTCIAFFSDSYFSRSDANADSAVSLFDLSTVRRVEIWSLHFNWLLLSRSKKKNTSSCWADFEASYSAWGFHRSQRHLQWLPCWTPVQCIAWRQRAASSGFHSSPQWLRLPAELAASCPIRTEHQPLSDQEVVAQLLLWMKEGLPTIKFKITVDLSSRKDFDLGFGFLNESKWNLPNRHRWLWIYKNLAKRELVNKTN